MTVRAQGHATHERAVFDAFLQAHPSFAAKVNKWNQPDAEFPDIIVEIEEGHRVDFELVEWLDGGQMARAMRRAQFERAVDRATGDQIPSPTSSIDSVLLTPRESLPVFEDDDVVRFRSELLSLIEDTERRWPSQWVWRTNQGRLVRELSPYPLLDKYLVHVQLPPARTVRRPPELPWIVVAPDVRAYSPLTAFDALQRSIQSKVARYGGLTSRTRLLVHYGRALAYNTPYLGVELRSFEDVANAVARVMPVQQCFEKIYLLCALEPGLEAFELFPSVMRCG